MKPLYTVGVILLSAVATGIAAWHYFHDSGIVVSVGLCLVYALLLTIPIPVGEWIRLALLRKYVEDKKPLSIIVDRCAKSDCPPGSHMHFEQVLLNVPTEKASCAYGTLKLAEKLEKDIRHDWERGIGLVIVMLIIYGTANFAHFGNSASGGSTAATAPSFDYSKAAIATLIGVFRLVSAADFLHWFRKQAGQYA